jgi:hypothetical protein
MGCVYWETKLFMAFHGGNGRKALNSPVIPQVGM